MAIGVYCLNVGQGCCVAIIDTVRTGRGVVRQATLIDVGADGSKLVQWLQFVGVQRIGLVAATHNDADHICGLEQLVHGFARRVGTLLFVPDRPEVEIPFWCDAQAWAEEGLVEKVDQLATPKTAKPGMGRVLVEPPDASYRLHCVYPTMFDTAAVVRRAKRTGGKLDRGPNATSAVIRLSRANSPKTTVVLFGGDLSFPGWRSLRESQPKHDLTAEVFVVPHHGAPRHDSRAFGHEALANAVRPQYAIISAGTRQKHVQKGRVKIARHPHEATVRALRNVGATVLCTQVTDRCLNSPGSWPGASVLPVVSAYPNPDLSSSGTACAGTVVITIKSTAPVDVMRVGEHQTAVDGLVTIEHPLCRP